MRIIALPIRKFYYICKLVTIVLFFVFIIACLNGWRKLIYMLSSTRNPDDIYELMIREDEARIIPKLGEGGEAVELKGVHHQLGMESLKMYAMNVYLSDRLPYFRNIRDTRNPACKRVLYDAELPSVSVVIIFHNEPYSVLVRTVVSVLETVRRDDPIYRNAKFKNDATGENMLLGYPGQNQSSKYLYIKEIILVDDASTLIELKGKLEYYMKHRVGHGLVKIVRVPKRRGLTAARFTGAQIATADVVIFLDAHCEPSPGWLTPLLQRLKDNPHACLLPLIDSINTEGFYYSADFDSRFQGLTAARLTGARASRADVVLFLDAHCEPAPDWLRPLLQRLRNKRDAIVTPLIDVIDEESFRIDAADSFQIGGFTFYGHYTWIEVPPHEIKRRRSEIDPTWSPTMAGGLFAMNRKYFWELGAYDEQMGGWGGENLELSFRVWMCGGTLESIPCSRVGHVFRSFHPYGLPAESDTHGINTARMAEVWMDEYKELYYLHRPDMKNSPKVGDITHRKVLREKLRCKSFQWYLDNVYPQKFVPFRDTIAHGRFQNVQNNICLDSNQRSQEGAALGLFQCHPTLVPTQMYSITIEGILRDEEKCAEVHYHGHEDDKDEGLNIYMFTCMKYKSDQTWQYLPSMQLQHVASGLCLDARLGADTDAKVRTCTNELSQQWDLEHSQQTDYAGFNAPYDPERDAALEKIRASSSGLTRARMAGARAATSDVVVLVFLDAHCEPITDWLRPLLQRLKERHDVVVLLIIHFIQHHSFN